jgi:NPCBM/NEW2 domain/Domain of unknown function (DUF1707)
VHEYTERAALAATATTAGELADLFTDLPAPHPKLPGIRTPGQHGSRLTAVVLCTVGVLALGGVGVALASGGGSAPSQPVALSAAPTTPPVPTTAAVQTSTSDTSSLTAGPTPSAVDGPKYLSELNAVDHGTSGSINSDSATANGTFFGHSVIFYNHCYNSAGGDIWAEYNLSRAYTTFTTTIGISDEDPAAAKGTYRVLVDGTEVRKGEVASGTSTPIELDVTNALHIRLEVNNQSAALQSCGQNNPEVHSVWGDARLS